MDGHKHWGCSCRVSLVLYSTKESPLGPAVAFLETAPFPEILISDPHSPIVCQFRVSQGREQGLGTLVITKVATGSALDEDASGRR